MTDLDISRILQGGVGKAFLPAAYFPVHLPFTVYIQMKKQRALTILPLLSLQINFAIVKRRLEPPRLSTFQSRGRCAHLLPALTRAKALPQPDRTVSTARLCVQRAFQ